MKRFDPTEQREKLAKDIASFRARGEEPIILFDTDAEEPLRVVSKAEYETIIADQLKVLNESQEKRKAEEARMLQALAQFVETKPNRATRRALERK